VFAALVAATPACNGGNNPGERGGGVEGNGAGGHVEATVVRPISDTLGDTARFEAVLLSHVCAPPARGVLLDGVSGGSGVLLWIRPGDSPLSGEYPYAPAGDTLTARTAIATLRFVVKETPRGMLLDSGRLELAERDGRISGRLRGSGYAVPGGMRVHATAEFRDVPPPSDTASCEVES
jgi:hypothetical protein